MNHRFHDGTPEELAGTEVVGIGVDENLAPVLTIQILDITLTGHRMRLGEMVPDLEAFLAVAQMLPEKTFTVMCGERFKDGNEAMELAWMLEDAPMNVRLPRQFEKAYEGMGA